MSIFSPSCKLITFDFDGVLVDSELTHFEAWKAFAQKRGYRFDLSIEAYFRYAHAPLGNQLHQYFLQDDPRIVERWQEARKEKSLLYTEMVERGEIGLMPHVPLLLNSLVETDFSLCVVTNSFKPDVELIKTFHPVLNLIPTWFTREHHPHPKPSPSGYQNALAHFGLKGAQALGIEDTLLGIHALQGAGIAPVWFCQTDYPHLTPLPGIIHITSLHQIFTPLKHYK